MVTSQERNAELQELFRRGIVGDQASYALFLTRITPWCRRVVARRIPTADIEDVVQEALISIHKACHTYDGARPLMPWLISIVSFRITDHLRKQYRTMRHATVDIDAFAETLADVTESQESDESIEALLKDVPEREQRILTMMHVEGYTAKETGERLGMKESAVKVAAHRAIKKIREVLIA